MIRKGSIKYEYYRRLSVDYKNTAKMLKCKASIHVEAAEDKLFWKQIFTNALPHDEFHFITYTRTEKGNLSTGCSTCLSYRDFLSDDFFICIDSDYRYLLQEKNIDVLHAIFQTYTYSIENHYCYSKGINNIFERLGLKNNLFNFDAFLTAYSGILYELFLYHLYSLSRKDDIFTKNDFKAFIGLDKPGLSSEKLLNALQVKTDIKLKELKRIYPRQKIRETERVCNQLGMNKENTYLYFRGHNLFDRVILPLVKEVRKRLELQYTVSFSSRDKKEYFQRNKELKSYFIENIGWSKYPEIKKIEADIYSFFMN